MFQEIPANKGSLSRRKLIYDIGINDVKYQVQPIINGKRFSCPYYKVWFDMFTRCYSSKYHQRQPTYIDCTICEEWRIFSNFKYWMMNQDWKGKQLDKDLLVKGNKIYSPETCIFVSQEVNKLLNTHSNAKGEFSLGVHWNKQLNKYHAQCNIFGKRKHLGLFLTEDEASKVYRSFKKELIALIANNESNNKLKEALLQIASEY